MSFSIKSIGPRAAVKAAVIANLNIPASLQASITEILDEPGDGYTDPKTGKNKPHDSARVEGYGHFGGGFGGIAKLEVELFTAAALPIVEEKPAQT